MSGIRLSVLLLDYYIVHSADLEIFVLRGQLLDLRIDERQNGVLPGFGEADSCNELRVFDVLQELNGRVVIYHKAVHASIVSLVGLK